MNEKEKLKVQFSEAAKNAKNAVEMRDAAASLPGNRATQIADFITDLCQAKGINPRAYELQEYYRQTAEYKAAIETQNDRETLGRAFTEIEVITKEFRDNESRGALPSQEQLDTYTDRIKKYTANLGAAQRERRIYTITDYMDECIKYDPSKDFTPVLFGGIAFPDGTTSYIGARTSRGKTTAMVNLARETLIGKIRKTIFITLEMRGKQLLNQIILSTAFSMGITADPKNRDAFMSMEPRKDIYAVWKDGEFSGNGAKVFCHFVEATHNFITEAEKSGAFVLYDGRGATEAAIINFMEAQAEKGTVILLDYIQKMPPKLGTDTDSFRRVQAISYDVVNAAAKTNSVIIAGAQFNRIGGMDALGDFFDDQNFREAGDIEQDAHNAIGIGWKIDKQARFYEVLKTREDKRQGLLYNLDFVGGYSYMTQGIQIHRSIGKTPKPTKKSSNNDTKETNKYSLG